jgi:Tol biopolymer transport system component
MRIPVGGGVRQFVLEMRNCLYFACARAPASPCVIAEMSQDRKRVMITAFEPLEGKGKVLRTIESTPSHPYNWVRTLQVAALSPDGSMFAVSEEGEAEIHIRLLSLSGASDREITVKDWPSIKSLNWSADGKGFYCGSDAPQRRTLLYVDLKGNARVLWQYKGGGRRIIGVPSPDGRYLAIETAVQNSNVWMVEGF